MGYTQIMGDTEAESREMPVSIWPHELLDQVPGHRERRLQPDALGERLLWQID